jgi:HSP20 family molecular chaperone IbpA
VSIFVEDLIFEYYSDLPGCDKNDLDIEIVDGCLVIKAERKHIHSKDTDTVHTMER